MNTTTREVITFIEENDVKFIRLAFCDLFGTLKNISIMPSQMERVFEEGIPFDNCAIAGFQNTDGSELYLIPDATTLDILPWRPQTGRVIRFFCEIRYGDGSPFERDTRSLLRNKLVQLQEEGYRVMTGMEHEFYLFHLDDQHQVTCHPLDQGTYLDVAPKDQGENIRREICLTLEEMGIHPESSHHEQGPGQNGVDFHFEDALVCCDHHMTLRWVTETIADAHDLHASFLPKPLPEKNGSGLHINLSLANNNHNAFHVQQPKLLQMFLAGMLQRMREITLFLNPCENSYERFREYEAPYRSWSQHNGPALIISKKKMRVEVRSPDASCNPYLAVYLLICAGIEGIREQLPLQEEAGDEMDTQSCHLPLSLKEAQDCAMNSLFIKKHLPEGILKYYLEYSNQR